MKHVIAFVKDRKLPQITHDLHAIEGVSGMTASSVRGFGRTGHAAGSRTLLEPRTRIDVFCADDLAETVTQAIANAAHTGLRGDGKIYVGTVQDALRIETGVRGDAAV